MNGQKDLIRAKKLITKYKGQLENSKIRENFGQSLVRKLEDEFNDYRYGVSNSSIWQLIREFDHWCMNYTRILDSD